MVSIILATYNRAHFLPETLNSIVNQTYNEWECLIIDDGSTDNTRDVLKPFLANESRFKYYRRGENYKKGLPGCRNLGLDKAKGEYIVFFDDDDIAHPQNLEYCTANLKSAEFEYCRYLRTTFRGNFRIKFDLATTYDKEFHDLDNFEAIIKGQIPFNSCQVMWKRKCFDGIRFNETLMYAEEWECYCRILSSGIKGLTINKVLFYGRKHPHSNTGEFHNQDPIRKKSKVKAAHLVIEHLASKKMFTEGLELFFLRMGLELRSSSIINSTLKETNAGLTKRLKYQLGNKIYPILKLVFRLKGKMSFT